ncbi:VTT domain-containing protein [uncultured Fretibacterium sp.]|uniref:TVP38/TMEM64 family protein n=1 Tax=uncultured Fretibacterium sp. TaxID=1678694 RepID=UPI00325FBCE1
MGRRAKPLILLGIAFAVLILNRHYGWSDFLSGPSGLEALREAVRRDVLTASLIYIAATTAGCVLLALPGVTFAIVAGLLFGPLLGTVLCLAAATIGAVLAFLAGRYFLRDAVAPWVERNRYLKRVLFEDVGRSGVVLLMITRLVPLFPYNLQNFAYGITGIGLWPYTLYTALFLAPGVTFFTLGAAGLGDAEHRRLYLILAGALAVLVTTAGLYLQRRYVGRSGA